MSRVEDQFRKRLLELIEENDSLKARLAESEAKLVSQQQLQKRVRSLERFNDDLQRTAQTVQQSKHELAREVRHTAAFE